MECPGRCSAFRIQAPGSTPRKRTGFSKRSIPRNRRAWESGWRSAARSSRLMAAGCGLSQAKGQVQPLCSACPMQAIPRHDRAGELRQRYEQLTPREREVMPLVAAGLLNKQVAGELATTERTIKFHRAHIM